MSKNEIEWETEDDVRMLMHYSKIMNDKKRKERALKALKEKQKEMQDLSKML